MFHFNRKVCFKRNIFQSVLESHFFYFKKPNKLQDLNVGSFMGKLTEVYLCSVIES